MYFETVCPGHGFFVVYKGKDNGYMLDRGMHMQEKQMQSTNGPINYWLGGNQSAASCIVCIHGMLADHTIFNEQLSFFKKDYKMIALDVPDHGKSRLYNDFTFERTAYELESILDAEQVDKAILIGQSMGGYICQEFGILFPEKVEAMIAVDSHPFGYTYYRKWERLLLTNIWKWASFFPYQMLLKIIARNANDTKSAYQTTLELVQTYDKKELIAIMEHVLRQFFERKDPVSFPFPVLLVVGEKEMTGFIKKYNIAWAKKEGYPLAVISNAAHNSNMDNANEFNAIVEGFLKQT